MRKGIQKVLDILNCRDNSIYYECEDVNFILTFPTGYGKTTLSLEIAQMIDLKPTQNFSRLIHVVPTRSLARDIQNSAFERGLRFAVQYSFTPSHIKSPLFLAKFIITTYDSFLLNLYKASIGEPFSHHGHYDLPRFGIYTSLVHFDEFHLMNEGNSWTSLLGAVRHLSKVGVNMILSSATPSRSVEEELIRMMENRKVVRLAVVNEYGESVKNRNCVKVSEGYYECKVGSVKYTSVEVEDKMKVPNININFLDEEDEVLGVVRRNKDKKIMVIVNTVDKAIMLYEKLRDLSPCLVHSRFKIGDRDEKLRKECNIIIATQVIEVGVNISSEMMITEQAPITSIVQRVGRLLRDKEKDKGELYIWKSGNYYPYDKDEVENTVKELEGTKNDISLKLPSSYGEIVDRVVKPPRGDLNLLKELDNIAENLFATKGDLEKLLDRYCSLTNSYVINVAYDTPASERDLIPLDGDLALKIAVKGNDCVYAYVEEYMPEKKVELDKVNVRETCVEITKPCRDYRKVFHDEDKRYIIYALKIDKELYNEETGLRLKK
ncbi:CRISPR-associated helicase Cas3 [Saccharolobus shibatae B12]|uniref:CRISPR-associated helicase Cas3 n=1 Tax=Saccharolobus shibatae (strain ATCC 51178 / DSM 5389 / JCM 8931 / NBRC 15437 / B12) TaxID=523848 RepID=A0A8F5BNZ8_SACSH|nr:CRISPR-associated helicase Cas3' [Saccharolobus shibatae]QXJ28803.1 CRISPR-associated helicase Cas3 [Saccharolobus shibatae B12]